MKRIICFVLAMVMALLALPVAFADDGYFPKDYQLNNGTYVASVVGGNSQKVVKNILKDEPNTIDVKLTYLDLNGQTAFKFRGYQAATNTVCSASSDSMNQTNYVYHAAYTASPTRVDLRMSIQSSSINDFVLFNGRYYI